MTTEILYGPPGSQPATRGFEREDRGDGVRLFNLAALIPAERRYSRINHGVKELIDHILLSGRCLPIREGRRVTPVVDVRADLQGGVESVGSDPGVRRGKTASDHAPVAAGFEV